MAFPCTKCGACCRLVGPRVMELRSKTAAPKDIVEQLLFDFPYQFTDEGACINYDPEKGCTIYDRRPVICRINMVFDHIAAPMGISRYQYYTAMAKDCNRFIDKLDLDTDFYVTTDFSYLNDDTNG